MALPEDLTAERPDLRHRLLALLAIGGGLGRLRPAPGTWGSAAAALPIAAGWSLLPAWSWALAALLVIGLGTRAVAVYTAGKGDHDPSEVVIDEVAGMLTAVATLAFGLALPFPTLARAAAAAAPGAGRLGQAGAVALLLFLLFRLFDIAKPGPIGAIDRRLATAAGAMLDDVLAGVAAGLAALVVLAARS